MSRRALPDGWWDQFASTYKEWHYFVGGIAIGFFVGVEYYRRYIDD